MSNTLMNTKERWNGEQGEHWAAESARFDRMLVRYSNELFAAAGLRAGERVLDVGCGVGTTTIDAAAHVGPTGRAVGVDVSRPLLASARARAHALAFEHLAFLEADAQRHRFAAESFDVVVSRFGMMLFDDPDVAFANLGRALRPGGRLAFVTWAEREANAWATIPEAAVAAHVARLDPVAAPQRGAPAACPFSLADPERTRSLLARAGFGEVVVVRRSFDVWVAHDITDAVDFVERSLGPARHVLRPDVVADALRTVRCALVSYARDDGVWLPSAAWTVSAVRTGSP
ncbi:MAG TPA: class I SAM-dependent methyltransferase [Acidimicrobiia bacterium]|nr:class I SAM-dependent methyltransferase [Acidimicrobiia bacterium]